MLYGFLVLNSLSYVEKALKVRLSFDSMKEIYRVFILVLQLYIQDVVTS
jgi:hypothetical protein